jgi:hypothetical protein
VVKDIDTGIHSIENGKSKIENYYDLRGRQVRQPGKGIYIRGGRKVMVK